MLLNLPSNELFKQAQYNSFTIHSIFIPWLIDGLFNTTTETQTILTSYSTLQNHGHLQI